MASLGWINTRDPAFVPVFGRGGNFLREHTWIEVELRCLGSIGVADEADANE